MERNRLGVAGATTVDPDFFSYFLKNDRGDERHVEARN